MILWGVFTTSLVTVHTVAPFMVLRALIGAAEAFIQGSIVYLSFWYRYEELATRGAIFFSTAALAGAFNGIISHSIQANLDGVNGWSPWRWIFLIEGVIPIGWGFVVAALLPGTPDNVRGIFSSAEKDIIVRRSRAAHNTGDSKIRLKAILQVLMDPTFWMLVGINAGIHFSVDSLPNFLPAILDEIGWKDQQAQLMSSIVYACAFVTTIGCAKVADRTGRRGLTIIACSCVGITGFVLLLTISSPIGRLVATCLVAMAVYPCIVLTLVWMALTTVGYSHRTSAAALINIAGQLFSIIGNVVYVDPPLYHRGLAVSAGMLAMSGIFAAGLIWRLSLLNKRKEDGKNTPHGLEQAKKSIDEIGNRHPRFMYGY